MDLFECEKAFKRPTNRRAFIKMLEEETTDWRTGNAVRHQLMDIMHIGLLCNEDTFTDMESFGETHEDELRNVFTFNIVSIIFRMKQKCELHFSGQCAKMINKLC